MVDSSNTWLIVGLGNPGSEYIGTRHNAGFMALDDIADAIRANYWKSECGSLVATKEYKDVNIVLAKPQSFMNLSGVPVSQLIKKYKLSLDRLIVIQDDLDLDAGAIRIKNGGGHGGHNGLKSIFEKLQSSEFLRIKVGIGRPPGRMSVVDYVLSKPKAQDETEFKITCKEAADATLFLIENGIEAAQAKFN